MSGRRILARFLLVALGAALAVTGVQLALAAPAAADPPAGDWARLRTCESGGRYDAVATHHHYGAYQFDLPTWRSVGGTGYPHRASPREQDFRALYLYRMRGWQPWTCARKLGLREDHDARSKRVPDWAEAAYLGGGGGSGAMPAMPAMPPWPGKVYAYGDCDAPLRAWQLRMNKFGYDFQGTGCYYRETRAAVLAVQRANGIRDSGRLGPKTWRAAWHGKPPR